jgi:hypothetical protein
MKKPKRKTLVKNLDDIFSKYIRLKNADKNGFCTCVTCGKKGYWTKDNIHCGHFISRKHYATRWDERNVSAQCHYCNTHKYGEQYKFSLYLGADLAQELYLKSKTICKITNKEIQDKIDKYKLLVKDLEKLFITL